MFSISLFAVKPDGVERRYDRHAPGLNHLAFHVPSRQHMELFIFARFHAQPGNESAVAAALQDVLTPSREEPGCLGIHAFRSIRDPHLFYILSRWKDEAAFDHHAGLPHTRRFIERMELLVDHPLEVTRAELIG